MSVEMQFLEFRFQICFFLFKIFEYRYEVLSDFLPFR